MANHQYTVFENDTKSLFFKSWRAKQARFISKQPNLTLLSELWIIDPVELGAREPRLGFFLSFVRKIQIFGDCGSQSIILALVFNANFLVIEHTV